MGITGHVTDALSATGEKMSRTVKDAREKVWVKRAEAERDATKAKNDFPRDLLDNN